MLFRLQEEGGGSQRIVQESSCLESSSRKIRILSWIYLRMPSFPMTVL
jgi:hypothetical protein